MCECVCFLEEFDKMYLFVFDGIHINKSKKTEIKAIRHVRN